MERALEKTNPIIRLSWVSFGMHLGITYPSMRAFAEASARPPLIGRSPLD